jgi:menaquinone-specific isochorismate synthase
MHFQPEEFHPLPEAIAFEYPEIVSREVSPSFEEWSEIIAKFKQSEIEKVVLARKSSFLFKKGVSPWGLFHFLRKKAPNAFVFAVIFSENLAFVGASPEKLFTKRGLEIETEALAGTKAGFDGSTLLTSAKDMREFLFVKETLTDQLQKICNPFSINQNILIKKAGNVSHLHYPFKAVLRNSLNDTDLIQYFHPTPAIGGRPRDLALDFIRKHEPFDRGYYAGTIGLSSNEISRVYVGIRSALISGNAMHVFTGAGILPESCPLSEWEELNHKQRLFGIYREGFKNGEFSKNKTQI